MQTLTHLLVTVAMTVVLAVAVTGVPRMTPKDKEMCAKREAMAEKIGLEIVSNLTVNACNDTNTDKCLDKILECQVALSSDELHNISDEELLEYMRKKMAEAKVNVEACASELGYSNIDTTTALDPPATIEELHRQCGKALEKLDQLKVQHTQMVPLAECTMRRQGLLKPYSLCVNGMDFTKEAQ